MVRNLLFEANVFLSKISFASSMEGKGQDKHFMGYFCSLILARHLSISISTFCTKSRMCAKYRLRILVQSVMNNSLYYLIFFCKGSISVNDCSKVMSSFVLFYLENVWCTVICSMFANVLLFIIWGKEVYLIL